MADLIIRPMRPEDAADWHEMRVQPQVMRGTLQLPTLSLDDVRAQCLFNPCAHKLMAEVDGKVVGNVHLQVGTGLRKHAGELGISVHDAYQGRGFGKALMGAALDLADNWLRLERVSLGVYPDNAAGIHLYRSFGFVEEGLSPGAALRDGDLVGILHMGRVRGASIASTTGFLADRMPPVTPTVRGLLPEDLRALYPICIHPAVAPAIGRLPSLQEDEFRKEYAAPARGHHVLVAQFEGQVLGMVHLAQFAGRRSGTGAIQALAVHPAWQGRGVGKALLHGAVDLAERWLGMRRLDMTVPVYAAVALALCERLGFTREAVLKGDIAYRGGLADCWLMARVR